MFYINICLYYILIYDARTKVPLSVQSYSVSHSCNKCDMNYNFQRYHKGTNVIEQSSKKIEIYLSFYIYGLWCCIFKGPTYNDVCMDVCMCVQVCVGECYFL